MDELSTIISCMVPSENSLPPFQHPVNKLVGGFEAAPPPWAEIFILLRNTPALDAP